VSVNVCPATLIVPVLEAPLLAPTLNATAAVPLPDAVPTIVIHGTFGTAVQPQFA
jgi:hypothetical protein